MQTAQQSISQITKDHVMPSARNYVHMVHAIKSHGKPFDLELAKATLRTIKDPRRFFRASIVCDLDAKTAERRLGWKNGPIKQTMIYGDSFGLTLRIHHPENIYVAWNMDIDSPHAQKDLEKFALKNSGRVKMPVELLTNAVIQNEIILRGAATNTVNGIFLLSSDDENADVNPSLRVENAFKFKHFLEAEFQRAMLILVAVPQTHRPKHDDYSAELVEIQSFS